MLLHLFLFIYAFLDLFISNLESYYFIIIHYIFYVFIYSFYPYHSLNIKQV